MCCASWFMFICIYTNNENFSNIISIMVRVFAKGPGDWGSIPGQVIPKTQKIVLDSSLLNTQHYKVGIKGKWSNPGKGIALSPIPRCCSY